ncbi:hypothetical protein [Bdellovibrio bacteriovorus]|uniref:hypothetical protein n=1 Tax=Bdellovibrio TaxID=958 RepID=UPI0035A924E8
MKKIGDLMAELGFNKDAPNSVKEAYIKHLIKASTGVNVTTPSEKKEMAENPQRVVQLATPQQLSFDFSEEKSPPSSGKKAVS